MGLAAVALGAAVVAPKMLLPQRGDVYIEQMDKSVLFSSSHPYLSGDIIQVSGFSDDRWNGKWIVMDLKTERCFVRYYG